MLNQIEKERIEQLENETVELRDELAVQQILISGLLHSLFRSDSSNREAFFTILSEELNKLRFEFIKHQDFSHKIQRIIDRYR